MWWTTSSANLGYKPDRNGFALWTKNLLQTKDIALSEAEQIAARITQALPILKRGTLCFWGQWFGRPYDNIHQIVACNAEHDLMHVHFNEDEILHLWSPQRATLDHQIFKIQTAVRVRWEWFAYGRPKTDRNRYFMDFANVEIGIDASTNVDWYKPNLQPDAQAPAVQMF